MHPTPGQKKALRSILDKSTDKIQLGTLATLKANGWIQLAHNANPMGTASSYRLTLSGRKVLGLREHPLTMGYAKTIGLEAETCEECGGAGRLLVLDESDRFNTCPWCQGTGTILEIF
ncbi:MAG: hypothetical protein HQM02_00390 [Magnetococcales bacterium]|nr:hypothetical protein [Magnetococcales bacterium]